MSRIGIKPITIPAGVTISEKDGSFEVVGSKGTLIVPRFDKISITQQDSVAVVEGSDASVSNFYGLFRSLLANAVQGVSTGWKRELELQGVGMRANVAGTTLNLSLGFSHPV